MKEIEVTEDLTIGRDGSVRECIQKLNSNSQQIVCVVDERRRLVGVVSDGDIRRKLLEGIDLNAPVSRVMNPNPLTTPENFNVSEIMQFLRHNRILQVPIITADRVLVGLVTQQSLLDEEILDNWVVIMAGGLGSRIRPLTDAKPKPMLDVAGQPIVETVLRNCILAGLHKYYISVNYHADQIKEYLGDGSGWNVSIDYLEETDRTGTAGSLALLPRRPTQPVFVMNADILSNINLRAMLDEHRATGALITVASRSFNYQVEFGVLETEGNRLLRLLEKPVQQYQINAGIYILDPAVFDIIGDQQRYVDMTSVIETVLRQNKRVSIFAIHEYWRDIGRIDDLEQARSEFEPNIRRRRS